MIRKTIYTAIISFIVGIATTVASIPSTVVETYIKEFPNTDEKTIEVIAKGVGEDGTTYWIIYAANKSSSEASGSDTEAAIAVRPNGQGSVINGDALSTAPSVFVRDKKALTELQNGLAQYRLRISGGASKFQEINAATPSILGIDTAIGLLRAGIKLNPLTPINVDGKYKVLPLREITHIK